MILGTCVFAQVAAISEAYYSTTRQGCDLYPGCHNFLRTTESCPPGFTDGEDGEGNIIEGGWQSDEERNMGLEPISRTSSNRY